MHSEALPNVKPQQVGGVCKPYKEQMCYVGIGIADETSSDTSENSLCFSKISRAFYVSTGH